MSADAPPTHHALAAFEEPNFRLYAAGRFASAAATMLLTAAIAWQVYDISGEAWQLGLIGLVRFIPSLGLSLVGGALADTWDRRKLTVAAQVLTLAAGLVLLVATQTGYVNLPIIYAAAFAASLFAAFETPARQALLPALVPPETFPGAITAGTTVQQLAFVTGPALAGGLIAATDDVGAAYAAFVALLAISVGTLLLLRPRRVELPKRAVSLTAIREGVQFVWHRQVLLGAMALDMFAVIFGGAQALLPIYAKDILDVGSVGYGLLYGSLDFGALLMSIVLVTRKPVHNTGKALLIAVALFGLGTIVFGLSRWFVLSLAAYTFIGMADQVSVVMRQTTIQLSTPDELRGRVTSVNMLFIGASNQLGAVESGFVAALTSATFAVVSGGIGCLAVVGLVAAKLPALWRFKISDAVMAEPVTGGVADLLPGGAEESEEASAELFAAEEAPGQAPAAGS